MERPHRPSEPFDLFRVRRSCLAVPASSERFIAKAHGLPADEVFLDLEDAVAPAAKAQATPKTAKSELSSSAPKPSQKANWARQIVFRTT